MAIVTKESVMELVKKKDELEAEIERNRIILQSQNDVGMRESLVDVEGYPRNDIDVYKVRHSRHDIICLQNDHKHLMKQIEEAMHALHAQQRAQQDSAVDTNPKAAAYSRSSLINETRLIERAFAKIDLVSTGSPAEEAGLRVGDLICEFGSINKRNFSSVQDIAVLVQHSVGHSVVLDVMRDEKLVHLNLVPKPWSEKGLLGCRVIPFNST